MDQQSSQRWLETLKAEKRAKNKWEHKYLTAEQQQRERDEQDAAFSELGMGSSMQKTKRMSERDAMEARLRALDDEENVPQQRPHTVPDISLLRQRVAAEVAATRARSHRFTGDLSTESMLKDIGPMLWTSVNPSYAPFKLSSSQHRIHRFDKTRGWGERVDKTHHLKMDDFMAHADKCLQLGEKPFTSGGMKLSGK